MSVNPGGVDPDGNDTSPPTGGPAGPHPATGPHPPGTPGPPPYVPSGPQPYPSNPATGMPPGGMPPGGMSGYDAGPYPGGPPGGMPPSGAGAPRRSGTVVAIVVVFCVVGLLLLAGAAVVGIKVLGSDGGGDDGGHRQAAGASTSTSSSPTPAAYSTLPDPCDLGDTKPKRVGSIKPDPGTDNDNRMSSCQWEVYHSDRAVHLDITLSSETGNDAVSEAHRSYLHDREYAREPSENNGHLTDMLGTDGLGDESFACQLNDLTVTGPSEQTAKSYYLGGAEIEVRSRNVIIKVDWSAATYSGASGKVLKGKNLDYADSREAATAVVKHLLANLS